MRHSQKKSPHFKSQEFKRKFISHLGQKIYRICELTVKMVQYNKKFGDLSPEQEILSEEI